MLSLEATPVEDIQELCWARLVTLRVEFWTVAPSLTVAVATDGEELVMVRPRKVLDRERFRADPFRVRSLLLTVVSSLSCDWAEVICVCSLVMTC